jgi:hypothetical protein
LHIGGIKHAGIKFPGAQVRYWIYSSETALQEIGKVAGDYIAGQLKGMGNQQKSVFLIHLAAYGSVRLHGELIRELTRQQKAWEALLRRRSVVATYDEIDRPGRMH